MKKIAMCIMLLLVSKTSYAQDPSIYAATCLTGGAACLDAIDVYYPDSYNQTIRLQDGDVASVIAVASNDSYMYRYDSDSGLSESSPDVIKPDYTNAVAYSGAGRWLLVGFTAKNITVRDSLSTVDATISGTADITTGFFDSLNNAVLLSQKYPSGICSAVTGIGSTETTVFIDSVVNDSGSCTIPSTMEIIPINGGYLGGAGTVNFDGGKITAGNVRVFGDNLTISGNADIQWASPAWFGSTCNDSTNDSAALNAVLSFNKAVMIPPDCVYDYNENLTVQNGQRLLGSGGSVLNKQGTYFLSIGGAVGNKNDVGVDNIHFRHEGSYAAGSYAIGCGQCDDVVIQNCKFSGDNQYHLYFADNGETRNPDKTYTSNISVLNNLFEGNNNSRAIPIFFQGVYGGEIAWNRISDQGESGLAASSQPFGTQLLWTWNVSVHDNTYTHVGREAIQVGSNCRYNAISGNHIDRVGDGGIVFAQEHNWDGTEYDFLGATAGVDDASRYNAVFGNTITKTAAAGISFNYASPYNSVSSNVVINYGTDLSFDDASMGVSSIFHSGVYFGTIMGNTVTGNVFIHDNDSSVSTKHGIYIGSSEDTYQSANAYHPAGMISGNIYRGLSNNIKIAAPVSSRVSWVDIREGPKINVASADFDTWSAGLPGVDNDAGIVSWQESGYFERKADCMYIGDNCSQTNDSGYGQMVLTIKENQNKSVIEAGCWTKIVDNDSSPTGVLTLFYQSPGDDINPGVVTVFTNTSWEWKNIRLLTDAAPDTNRTIFRMGAGAGDKVKFDDCTVTLRKYNDNQTGE